MLVANCPHCGKSLAIPQNKPEEFVCPYCSTKLNLTYDDAQDSVSAISAEKPPAKAGLFSKIGSACKNVASKTVKAAREHPKITAAIAIAVAGGLAYAVFGKDKAEELLSAQNSAENDDTPPHMPESEPLIATNDAQEIEDVFSDDSEDTDYTDWDILSYLGEHCRNCGASLAGGYYTDPWEDGDNEYGYWTCPRCGAINYDWDSNDD